MSYTVLEEERGGYTLRVEVDEHVDESPRNWCNLGTMVCWHHRYNLGDEHDWRDPDDFIEWMKEQGDKLIVLPLYLYDHSGITMSCAPFSCPWDSGQVGFIFVTADTVRAEYGWKRITKARRAKIEEYLRGEVETYDRYLRGEVYGYTVSRGDEEIDSCWGFYGEPEEVMKEAVSAMEYDEKQRFPLIAAIEEAAHG